MIISTDYSYLRTGTWQSELSREQVFQRFPDKRSWWIDSSGEIFDAGKDHDKFVKEHPELFDHDEGDTTYYAVRKMWARISAWGPSFTINTRNINQAQLDSAQDLYRHEGQGKKVEFFQEGVIPTSFDGPEFLALDKVSELKRMRSRVGMSASDFMKAEHPDKRSWWVNPTGQIFDAGHDHNKFLEERPKTFGKYADINKALTMNWIRVAFWGGEFVVHCHSINRAQLEACQEIYKSLGGEYKIYISTLNKYGYCSPHDFIWADSQADLIKNLFKDPTGIRAASASEWMKGLYPDKRSWWISSAGEVFDAGYDHEKFVQEHPELFGSGENRRTVVEQKGWAKVGSYGREFTIFTEEFLNQRQLDAAQTLYHESNKPDISIVVGERYAKLTRDEFLQADTVAQLMRETRRWGRRRAGYYGKNSWWISPGGEAVEAGDDHGKFAKDHPEIFGGIHDVDALLDKGWVRTGDFRTDYFVHAKSLSQKQLDTAQSLLYETPTTDVLINVRDRYAELTRDEFLQADSVPKLMKQTRVHGRRTASETRAWLVSPDRQVINCGSDHSNFIENHQDLMREMGAGGKGPEELVREGWSRIGLLGPLLYINCKAFTGFLFKIMQELTDRFTQVQRLIIDNKLVDRNQFLYMDGPGDMRQIPVVGTRNGMVLSRDSRIVSSLPKSRNFLMGVDLESMSWPLRRAFDLLNLSGKKDRLSANQVASAFQANDEFLQDHLGRTATELIQDMNAFVQYGPQKQMA